MEQNAGDGELNSETGETQSESAETNEAKQAIPKESTDENKLDLNYDDKKIKTNSVNIKLESINFAM